MVVAVYNAQGNSHQDPRARFLKRGALCDMIDASLGPPGEMKTEKIGDSYDIQKSYQSFDGNHSRFGCYDSHISAIFYRGEYVEAYRWQLSGHAPLGGSIKVQIPNR
jgi:hypothetical protein